MALTPFDIDKYRNAQPVMTRDGRQVFNLKQLFIPELNETYLTAVVNLKPITWDISGKRDYIYGTEDALDLFMDEPIEYKWVLKTNVLDVNPENYITHYLIKIIPVES